LAKICDRTREHGQPPPSVSDLFPQYASQKLLGAPNQIAAN